MPDLDLDQLYFAIVDGNVKASRRDAGGGRR